MSQATASQFQPRPLDRDATFYVAGHGGLVGSAIWRKLESDLPGLAEIVIFETPTARCSFRGEF